MLFYIFIDWSEVRTEVHNINTSRKDIKKELHKYIFCPSQIRTCYHMMALRLILDRNVWTDNAGLHGCKKQHHLRTKGNMKALVEMVTFGVHIIPSLLWEGHQDGNNWINYLIASIICNVKNSLYKESWKILV